MRHGLGDQGKTVLAPELGEVRVEPMMPEGPLRLIRVADAVKQLAAGSAPPADGQPLVRMVQMSALKKNSPADWLLVDSRGIVVAELTWRGYLERCGQAGTPESTAMQALRDLVERGRVAWTPS